MSRRRERQVRLNDDDLRGNTARRGTKAARRCEIIKHKVVKLLIPLKMIATLSHISYFGLVYSVFKKNNIHLGLN